MKKIAWIAGLAALVLFAGRNAPASDLGPGEDLERQMWKDLKAKNWERVESRIAEGFQSIHQDGARDRNQEIALLKGLNLGDYTLSDFKETSSGGTIVVTYFISVKETIDGKILGTAPAGRISIWVKTDKGWQWAAHANLNPLK